MDCRVSPFSVNTTGHNGETVVQYHARSVSGKVGAGRNKDAPQEHKSAPLNFSDVHSQVHVVASLPCYSPKNVNMQRGSGVFDRSIKGLMKLNALGYGRADSDLKLDLVYNPVGGFLPPEQVSKLHHRNVPVGFGCLAPLSTYPLMCVTF